MNFVTVAGYVKHGAGGLPWGSGALGPGICRISYMDFAERLYHDVGCIGRFVKRTGRLGKAKDMTDWTSSGNVMGSLNRLIEAQDQVEKARQDLAEYQETAQKPGPSPSMFNNVNELLAFIKRDTDYKRGLEEAQGKVQQMRTRYQAAAEEVQQFLPKNSVLFYDYQGQQPSFQNRRYGIYHRGGRVTVEGWTSSS